MTLLLNGIAYLGAYLGCHILGWLFVAGFHCAKGNGIVTQEQQGTLNDPRGLVQGARFFDCMSIKTERDHRLSISSDFLKESRWCKVVFGLRRQHDTTARASRSCFELLLTSHQ